MGQEDEAAARRRAFAGYIVDQPLLARAAPNAIVLHCLPAHRGEEIAGDVLDGPQSLAWVQAENRLHVGKAILEAMLA
jgi:ornithine carbamoyltransferase